MASWRGRFAPASRERRDRLSAIRAPGRCFPDFYRALAPTCRLDTHAFLWLIAGDERLPATARTMIEDAEEVLLSTASVWEAEIKRAAGQLDAPAIAGAARRARVAQLAITSRHATVAAHLPMHHRDPFDRMIVAQTRVESLVLVSKDEAVRRYGVAAAW